MKISINQSEVGRGNVKFKIILFLFSVVLFSGCGRSIEVWNENRDGGGKNIFPMHGAVDLEEAKKPIKILFVGDMMFDRQIRLSAQKYAKGDYGYTLEDIKNKLLGYDLVVGNLEGPITDRKSTSAGTEMGTGENMVFTFDPAVAKTLAENNIKLVNLGNNHILNQGEEGLAETKKYLGEAGIIYFGDTGNDGSLAPVKDVQDIDGVTINFVSYNYSVPNSSDAVVEEIKKAKEQSDFVIVLPHWGKEYKTGDPGPAIRSLGHEFIDAGADLVIGTHPHVIETSELYKNKKVYYSLGNFIFDQYFSKDTMEGLGVEVEINPDSKEMKFQELRFEMMKNGQTRVKE